MRKIPRGMMEVRRRHASVRFEDLPGASASRCVQVSRLLLLLVDIIGSRCFCQVRNVDPPNKLARIALRLRPKHPGPCGECSERHPFA